MYQIFDEHFFLLSKIITFHNYFMQMFAWRNGVLFSWVWYCRSIGGPICFIVPMLLSSELGRKWMSCSVKLFRNTDFLPSRRRLPNFSHEKRNHVSIVWMKVLAWYVRSLFKVPFCHFLIHWVILNVEWCLLSFLYLQHKKLFKVGVLLIINFPAAFPRVSADNSGPGPAVVSWPQPNVFPENKYIKSPYFPYYGINVHNIEEMSGCTISCRKLSFWY